jgi:hypothetical protein
VDEGWTLDGTDTAPADVPDEDAGCFVNSLSFTETTEDFVVPEGARYMWVKAWGSGANGEVGCEYSNGGLGGFTSAVFAVTPGDDFLIIVGGRNWDDPPSGETAIRLGLGHRGGGGLSGVFVGGSLIDADSIARALVIAGGGGGASASAGACRPGHPGNHTEDAGGMSTMMGGPGGDGVNGGGGGYEGGTGGDTGWGGNGGTGFVHSTALGSTMLNGEVGDPSPPRASDDDYNGVAGNSEEPGLVHSRFVCEIPSII